MAVTSHPVARLLLGWLLPPLAWAMHLGLAYGLVPWVCAAGPVAAVHAVSIGCLLLALAGLLLGTRNLRAIGRGRPDLRAVAGSRFIAVSGLLMGGLFTAVIVAQSLPPLLLGGCR